MYIQYSSFDVLVRSAALFIVHAVSSHVDLTSLAELRVQETVPSCPEFFVVVFFSYSKGRKLRIAFSPVCPALDHWH